MRVGEVVWKIPLKRMREQFVELPHGAEALAVQRQGDTVVCWVRVNAAARSLRRLVTIVGTGHIIPPGAGRYVGTVQDGSLVWHVFLSEEREGA